MVTGGMHLTYTCANTCSNVIRARSFSINYKYMDGTRQPLGFHGKQPRRLETDMERRANEIPGVANGSRRTGNSPRPGICPFHNTQNDGYRKEPVNRESVPQTRDRNGGTESDILHKGWRVRNDGAWRIRRRGRSSGSENRSGRSDDETSEPDYDTYDNSAREPDIVRPVPQRPRSLGAQDTTPCPCPEECPLCNPLGSHERWEDTQSAYILPWFVFDQGWTWPV